MVDGNNDALVLVVGVLLRVSGDVDTSRVHLERDIGELAVVSGAHRVDVVHVGGVRVHMVTSGSGDGGSLVPRLDEREVVRGETSQTSGVLV